MEVVVVWSVEVSSHTLRQSGAGRAARGEAGLQVCLWPLYRKSSPLLQRELVIFFFFRKNVLFDFQ